METITLRKATIEDKAIAVEFDYQLDPVEHIELRREEKIAKAIQDEECFLILVNGQAIGLILFDYRFFDQGWIELIIVAKAYRGKGIGSQAMALICEHSNTNKVFTSTNQSNTPMQRALAHAGFTLVGQVDGLDEGDPELFYLKKTEKRANST